VATGKAKKTRKPTKSAGKTKTPSAARKSKAKETSPQPATRVAKRTKTASARKPKTAAKPTGKSTPATVVSKSSTRSRIASKTSSPGFDRPPGVRGPSLRTGPVTVQWGTDTIELADDGEVVPKTKLSKRELRAFKELLLAKRQELVGDVLHLTDQALRSHRVEGGGSGMPLHMADIGSDNWEQEFTLGLIENERVLLREIDDALERIESRIYGVCLATHRPIESARLRAKPWAKYCVEYARLRELGRVP